MIHMYTPQKYENLLGTPGFSDDLLTTHFGLYEGYVKNTNSLMEKLTTLEASSSEYKELRRRLGWEFNGMRLHELYFGGMSKEETSLPDDSALLAKIKESFETGQACHDDFKKAAGMRGVGWVVMYYDKQGDKIINTWIDDHATNHLAGATPLIVMDMWEHAFVKDYNMNKADYLAAYIKAIDWNVAADRFSKA